MDEVVRLGVKLPPETEAGDFDDAVQAENAVAKSQVFVDDVLRSEVRHAQTDFVRHPKKILEFFHDLEAIRDAQHFSALVSNVRQEVDVGRTRIKEKTFWGGVCADGQHARHVEVVEGGK